MKKTKYHSLDKISRKEFIELFQGPLKKLLYYAESQGITVKPLCELISVASPKFLEYVKHIIEQNFPFWAVHGSTIFADVRDLELGNQKKRITALACFTHEIVHIQDYLLQDNLDDYCRLSFDYCCPFVEYHCSKEGLEIIKKLEISINSNSFWRLAFRGVACHRKFCPKFGKCKYPVSKIFGYKIKESHIRSVLFWKKQKEKLGIKEIMKDYLLK